MNLQNMIDQLNLEVLTVEKDFSDIKPITGYTSDLLSCVMAGAKHGSIWVTLQAHINIVAVAALLEVSAVIITEGAMPEEETIAKANSEGITLLSSSENSFHVVGKLWQLGLRDK